MIPTGLFPLVLDSFKLGILNFDGSTSDVFDVIAVSHEFLATSGVT